MAYQKNNWRDYDETKTELQNMQNGAVVTPERLNHIENGIANSADKAEVTAQLAQKANQGEVRLRTVKLGQTDMEDEFLQQMAGDTPINSVPANGSITKERLTPRVIGAGQTDFVKVGKNLFNKYNLISGYLISADGELSASTNYHVSDYILISPDTEYHFSAPPIFAWYDDMFNFISRVYQESGVFTSPINARYLRVSASSGYAPNLQIEKGSEGTDYEEPTLHIDELRVKGNQLENESVPRRALKKESVGVSQTDFIRVGKNLFDKSKTVVGRISPSTGSLNTSEQYSNFRSSDFIEIEPNSTYSKSGLYSFSFYDENKVFIPINYDGVEYGDTVETFTSPENARYIRVSTLNAEVNISQLEQNGTPTSYEEFGYKIDSLLLPKAETPVYMPKKYPSPAIVTEERYRAHNNSRSIAFVDRIDNKIWATAPNQTIQSSVDGETFTVEFDTSPYLNVGESISGYALYIGDTGRIIVSTSDGRVLVSDEGKTTMSEAFTFKAGQTNLNRGHAKYANYIFMGSYLTNKNAENPGREVYMSRDHGATWELIFDKPIVDMLDAGNYHIHDVAFDPYSQMIIISIGDGLNRQIHYSYDFGETWKDMFDENDYNAENWVPIHPTSILCFPEGFAFGSDELPEGISWWQRPEGNQPDMKWEDVSYKATFGKDTGLIGTYAMKGDILHTESGFYGVMPFRNHQTVTEGHPRLFATGDGGRSWHEIFRENEWSNDYAGFMNAVLQETDDGIYIYAHYSQLGTTYIWRAKMPNFYEV